MKQNMHKIIYFNIIYTKNIGDNLYACMRSRLLK